MFCAHLKAQPYDFERGSINNQLAYYYRNGPAMCDTEEDYDWSRRTFEDVQESYGTVVYLMLIVYCSLL